MTKEEFKTIWESDETGGGLTYDDVADCAKAWGISSRPRTSHMSTILYRVLKEANTNDAEEFYPKDEE